MNPTGSAVKLFLSALICLAAAATSREAAAISYSDVRYPSGALSIEAYLYKPSGDGPFPVVIYNHGSRAGNERRSMPYEYIGEVLTAAGYVVLVPERRGYGRSDGATLSEEVGGSRQRVVPRLEAETDDVLATLPYLRTLAFTDMKRVGIMGWSFGGIVTMFAISRSAAFAVAVNQAGGALTWNGNRDVRLALTAAAEKTATPTLLQVAQNDRTTDSITTLEEIFKRRQIPHRAVIYEPFTPRRPARDTPPGHRIFSAEGVELWEKDVLQFLSQYLGKTTGNVAPMEPAMR